MRVEKNKYISIRYTLKNSQGDTLEDNLRGTPITYQHGTGKILRALETNLEGLREGSVKSFTAALEDAGQFQFHVVVDRISDVPWQENPTLQEKQTDGEDCGPGCKC